MLLTISALSASLLAVEGRREDGPEGPGAGSEAAETGEVALTLGDVAPAMLAMALSLFCESRWHHDEGVKLIGGLRLRQEQAGGVTPRGRR